jgi:hypothetical protein
MRGKRGYACRAERARDAVGLIRFGVFVAGVARVLAYVVIAKEAIALVALGFNGIAADRGPVATMDVMRHGGIAGMWLRVSVHVHPNSSYE